MEPERDSTLRPCASEELDFWMRESGLEGEFAHKLRCRLDPARRREEFPPMLLDPILPMLRAHFGIEGAVRCLELGPGPLSSLAHGVDEGLLRVSAVDVLADEYIRLQERCAPGFPIRPIPGSGETLDQLFPEESFECAFARNSLDHTDDIAASFRGLVRRTRRDGAIILSHALSEGTRRGWSPSHKWDLDLAGTSLVARNRRGERVDLGALENLEVVYLCYRSELLDGWIDIVYRRLPERTMRTSRAPAGT